MQAWCTRLQQLFAQACDNLFAELANRFLIVTEGFQAFANPTRDFRTAHIGESRQLRVIGDGHDAWHDRNIYLTLLTFLDETIIGIRVEKVLRQCTVGTGIDLAFEIIKIAHGVFCLWVYFGVGGNFDKKVIAVLFPDEVHQFIGIIEIAAAYISLSLW